MTEALEIIVAARDMAAHVSACVTTLVGQLGPQDKVTVVDDGSADDTASAARRAGAEVLRLDRSRGPYVARQLAALRSQAEGLLFVDARSRARPGLLDAHRALLRAPGVALSCTDVRIVAGRSFASRVFSLSEVFSVSGKVGVPGQLGWFPTCNLGVRRDAFAAVDGFRLMRSGGDIDLCYRVQLGGHGELTADPRPLMDWVPRDTLRALVEQAYRYGRSQAFLDALYPAVRRHAAAPEPDDRRTSPDTGFSVRHVVRQSLQEPGLIATRATGRGLTVVQAVSRRIVARRLDGVEPPARIPPDG